MSAAASSSTAIAMLLLGVGALAGCDRQPKGVTQLDDPVLRQREVPGASPLDAPLRHALARPRATPDIWNHVYAAETVGDGFVRYMQIRTAWSVIDYANRYTWYAVECGVEPRQRVLGDGPRARDAESGRNAKPARALADDGIDGRIADYLCRASHDCPAHDRDTSSRCRAEWQVEQEARAEMLEERSATATSAERTR